MYRRLWAVAAFGLAVAGVTQVGLGQPPGGPGGFKGGFGPPGGAERKLLKQFDTNKDGWLNAEERKPAREAAKKGGRGGFGGPKGFGRGEPGRPGPKVSPSDVKPAGAAALYDPSVLRTLFFQFENPDWESELEDFHGTDIDVPATLTVDGKVYPNVGVHFRGMSSYGMVPAGSKRSLNVALDLADPKQRLLGYKTLNLLNSHEDPSLLSTVLYSHVARQHIPAPKANLVRVVINGEYWGVYPSVQQFNKEFLQENYKTTKGTRWKVRGSPGGGGGLEYAGDNPEDYKRRFEIKSTDDPKAWAALVNLCKVLNQTPPDRLEAALKPILDVEGLLWFLALDVALVNNDGYWVRASDYSLYLDPGGKFHVIPHDMNEAFKAGGGGPGGFGPPGGGRPGGPGGPGGGFMFRPPTPGELLPTFVQDSLNLSDDQKKQVAALQKEVDGKLDLLLTAEQKTQLKALRERGPGGGMGPMGGGVDLDPLVALTDPRKPLRSKVLAVPALKAKYLANVKAIADKALDWKELGPVVAGYRKLIEPEVKADTRKLDSFEAFQRATADTAEDAGRGRGASLRAFADQRRKFLLGYTEPAAKR